MKQINIILSDKVWTTLRSETTAYLLVRGGQPGNVLEAFVNTLVKAINDGELVHTFRFESEGTDGTPGS